MSEVFQRAAKAFEDPDTVFWIVVTLPVTMLIAIGFSAGVGYGQHRERSQAIEAKAGRWVVNASTGETTFVYGGAK